MKIKLLKDCFKYPEYHISLDKVEHSFIPLKFDGRHWAIRKAIKIPIISFLPKFSMMDLH